MILIPRRQRLVHSAAMMLIALSACLIPLNSQAKEKKPNIILILSDDFGYGDSSPYEGGQGRGMPTPSLEKLANEGMTFFSFYAQPSCTPGCAAVQTAVFPKPQRYDYRSHSGSGRRTSSG